MRSRNCPNCGAPIDYEQNKCAFCGTLYYDFSCMSMNQPFFLRIKLDPDDKETILAKVRLNTTSIKCERDAFPEIELNLCAYSFKVQKMKGELKNENT